MMLAADAFLIVEKRRTHWGNTEIVIVAIRQGKPALKSNQRAVKIRVEIDEAVFEPAPTPETTIVVHSPIAPEPEVVVTEDEPDEEPEA